MMLILSLGWLGRSASSACMVARCTPKAGRSHFNALVCIVQVNAGVVDDERRRAAIGPVCNRAVFLLRRV